MGVPFKKEQLHLNLSAANSYIPLVDLREWNRLLIRAAWTAAATGSFYFAGAYDDDEGTGSPMIAPAGSVHPFGLPQVVGGSVTLTSGYVVCVAATTNGFIMDLTELPPYGQLGWIKNGAGANDCLVDLYMASLPNR